MTHQTSKILYYVDSTPINQKDIENALMSIGVKKGDVIMIHSDIGSFGRLGTFDRNFLLQSLVDSFKNSVGDSGTIIMPTFTYSFLEDKPYDVSNSKSIVGTLTEYFRKLPDVSRTAHPTHSVAIWGKNKKNFLNIGKGTFDKESVFGKLHQMNGKIVFFGVSFNESCTYVHYIERMHRVPYRYMKKLRGKIIANGKRYEDEILFYKRYSVFLSSFLNFEKYIIKKNILKEIKLGNNSISMVECGDLFKEGCKLLDDDIYFLVKNDTIILNIFNKSIYLFLKYFPWPIRILNDAVSTFFKWFRKNNNI